MALYVAPVWFAILDIGYLVAKRRVAREPLSEKAKNR